VSTRSNHNTGIGLNQADRDNVETLPNFMERSCVSPAAVRQARYCIMIGSYP
jgi:hypothetical protein